MKIAFFVDTFDPQVNGVTVSVNNLIEKLQKEGHQIYVFAPEINHFKDTKKSVYRIPSFTIIKIEPEIKLPYMLSPQNLKTIMQLDFDIIHGHGNGAISFIGYLVAKYKKVPYVMTFHNLFTEYTHHILNGKIITPKMAGYYLKANSMFCDAISTPSEKMKLELIKFGVKKPIKVIPNFVNLEEFDNNKKGFLREKYKISNDEIILLTVGRIDKAKNFQFLIETFASVEKSSHNTTFVVVGQGPSEKDLERLAQKLNIKKIIFTGFIPTNEMPKVYKDSDIFIFASKSETQGISVLEAGASGLPFVIVKDDSFSGMVEDNLNGFMLDLDKEKFADKILELAGNKKLRDEFSEQSKIIIKKNFNADLLTGEFINFYTKAINERNKN